MSVVLLAVSSASSSSRIQPAIFQKNVISRSQERLKFSTELAQGLCACSDSPLKGRTSVAVADRSVSFIPWLLEQEGPETPGGFCMAHAFLGPPLLLGKLPWFFNGICSPENCHQVSGLMLHYEIVTNIFRKGEELFRGRFCIFHFSYFPVVLE